VVLLTDPPYLLEAVGEEAPAIIFVDTFLYDFVSARRFLPSFSATLSVFLFSFWATHGK